VETNFARLPRAVLEGAVDTGIWHSVDLLIPLDAAGLEVRQLTRPQAIALATELSNAVVVARKDTEVGAVVSRIDLQALRAEAPAAQDSEIWDGEIPMQLPDHPFPCVWITRWRARPRDGRLPRADTASSAVRRAGQSLPGRFAGRAGSGV
jgi:hypothetical protein